MCLQYRSNITTLFLCQFRMCVAILRGLCSFLLWNKRLCPGWSNFSIQRKPREVVRLFYLWHLPIKQLSILLSYKASLARAKVSLAVETASYTNWTSCKISWLFFLHQCSSIFLTWWSYSTTEEPTSQFLSSPTKKVCKSIKASLL